MNTKIKPTDTEKAVRQVVDSMTKELAVICPTTGLLVPNGLPPMLGSFLPAQHALAIPENAKAIIKDPNYYSQLDKGQKCGLILAALNAYRHLSLSCPAIVVRLAMETRLNNAQINSFLEFITDNVLTTTRGYPALILDRDLSQYTFLDYINQCAQIEMHQLEPGESAVVVKIPKFISGTNQGKSLDKECYEEWLEAAARLPKDFVAKAQPFVKTLATNPSSIIDKMLTAVEGAALKLVESIDQVPEVVWFIDSTVEARKKAKALGLHSSLDDIEGLTLGTTSVVATTTSTSLALEALDVPSPELAPATSNSISPFAARMAALKDKLK